MTKELRIPDSVKYYPVTFLAGGGARKNGCIIEQGSSIEYEKPDHLRLILNCADLIYRRSWGLSIDNPADQSTWTDEVAERYFGEGEIEPSPDGEYSFSFFGSARTHRRLRVVIRRAARKTIYFVPSKAEVEGLSVDESFAVEAILDAVSFDQFKEELRANPGYRTDISIRLDGLSGIYTTLKGNQAGARVLKILNNLDDVSNRENMPDEFGAVVLGEPFPFSVTVGHAEI